MSTRVPEKNHEMEKSTVESLQELTKGLCDSVIYLNEAAERINSDEAKKVLNEVASARRDVFKEIGDIVLSAGEPVETEGTFLGSLRTIWASFRVALNSGDNKVALIEAERAEDVIVNKFRKVLPEIAGNPSNDRLLKCFEKVKEGHDRVLAMRNYFQDMDS